MIQTTICLGLNQGDVVLHDPIYINDTDDYIDRRILRSMHQEITANQE